MKIKKILIKIKRKAKFVGPVISTSLKQAGETAGKKWQEVLPPKPSTPVTIAATVDERAEDDDDCDWILTCLTDTQKECAARSSYVYLNLVTDESSNSEIPNRDQLRDKYALLMARRHLVAEKGDKEKALEKMKSTIAFRQGINVDVLRQCFHKKQFVDSNEEKLYKKLRSGIKNELMDGKHYIRGSDQDNGALFVIFPHRYSSFDPEWYLLGKLYNIERAIAYTERKSKGKVEKINVLFDYSQYTYKNQPPLDLIKQLMSCLSDHYPERLRFLFFIDTPMRFRAFWNLLKPFIDPVTRNKIQFVTGDAQKLQKFRGLISEDQAMAMTNCVFGMDKYNNEIPFDCDMDGN